MTAERWTAPASAEVETEHARRVARSLRAEIAVYQQQIDDWTSAGGRDGEVAGLRACVWTLRTQAAAIERSIRGIG